MRLKIAVLVNCMGNKVMKFKEMIVDLTPLLDVILILLFMVLASQSQASNETIATLEAEVTQLETMKLPQTPSEEAWYQTYQQAIGKVNIVFPSSIDYEPMYVIQEDGTQVYKAETEDLQAFLTSQIASLDEDVIIVAFSYNNDAIYLRDYRNIVSAITQLDQISEKTVVYQEQLIKE